MKIAIIDETGREKPDQMKPLKTLTVPDPKSQKGPGIFSGKIDGLEVFYLSSYGMDGQAADNANLYAASLQILKDQGCEIVLSTSACSSLRKEICPGECIIPDRFMDLTRDDFWEEAAVNKNVQENKDWHIDLFSEELRDHLTEAAIIQGITVHNKGTVITIKDGKVLTESESDRILALGGDIIDHSTSSEVMAAHEVALPYARVLLCTAYVSAEMNKAVDTEGNLQKKIDDGYRKIMQILSYAIKKVQQEELTD